MSQDVSSNENEETYAKIVSFYDFAEELIDTVEDDSTEDPVTQLEFVEPIVSTIEESTDILAEEYRNFIRTSKSPGLLIRRKIAKSLKKIYSALNICKMAKNNTLDKKNPVKPNNAKGLPDAGSAMTALRKITDVFKGKLIFDRSYADVTNHIQVLTPNNEKINIPNPNISKNRKR